MIKPAATSKERRPLKRIGVWLLTIGFIVLLGLSMARLQRTANAQDQEINLTVQTSEQGCIVPYVEYPISFDGRTFNTTGTDITRELHVAAASTQISISMSNRPNVKVARVEVVSGEGDRQTYSANASGVALVTINHMADTPTIVVYLSGLCDETSQPDEMDKLLGVILSSQGCKSTPQWDGLSVVVGKDLFAAKDANFVDNRTRIIQLKITSEGPTVIVALIASAFPKTKIESATLTELTENGFIRLKGDYQPGSGSVVLPLPKSLWKKKNHSKPALGIQISGNCEDPGNPDEFGRLIVKAVSGEVEIEQPISEFEKQQGKNPISKAKVDDRYRPGTLVTTGKDGLIILESEYKHTIVIDSSTQVRLADLMTPSGREQLSALLKRGKIKVERRAGTAQNTAVQTDTAIVTSVHTIYEVTYDQKTRLTTVSVGEGEVKVFPANETLESVKLSANERVQVSDTQVVKGNALATWLFYIGIGAGGLIGLIILVVIVYVIFRVAKKSTYVAQPAVAARPRVSGRPRQPGQLRCPNPRCGAPMLVNNRFCGVCGSALS